PFAVTPRVIGGRYGLASKEFTPDDVRAVFAELALDRPKRLFTVGIVDDVTHLSLTVDRSTPAPRPAGEIQALFFGLGADGTVGANKSSVKIIGEHAGLFAQGYFVYDSKKSGSATVSHLRFGPEPIRSTYLVEGADFVACHQFGLLGKMQVLEHARPGATFLLNSPYPAEAVWDHLPLEVQQQILAKRLAVWWSTPTGWRPGRGWASGATPSCSPASSSWPACCRPTTPSPTSRRRWRRPTASGAGPWWSRTSPPSTPPSARCAGSRSRRSPPRRSPGNSPSPPTPPTS